MSYSHPISIIIPADAIKNPPGSHRTSACGRSRLRLDSALDEALLHDVGTLRTTSGSRLGETLVGVDTPTLRGLWATAPYLHDGTAETLEDVFVTAGGTLIPAESGTPSSDGQ